MRRYDDDSERRPFDVGDKSYLQNGRPVGRNDSPIARVLWLFAAILLLIALMAVSAYADWRPVVKIGGCSGVCISGAGHVLTTKHCPLKSREIVTFGDGRRVWASKVFTTRHADGTVVFDCDGDGFPYHKVAEKLPHVGETVQSAGYPYGVFRTAAGRYTRTLNYRGMFVWELSFPVDIGWSGGPIYNAKGEVCAVMLATDDRTSIAVPYRLVAGNT